MNLSYVIGEHTSFIFGFYSSFDEQCFLLPHLSIGSLHNIQHLLNKANVSPSFRISDIPFKLPQCLDHSTLTEHVFTQNKSHNSSSPPLFFHSYINQSTGRFIRGNFQPKSNSNNNNEVIINEEILPYKEKKEKEIKEQKKEKERDEKILFDKNTQYK
jgi:hypothetical protein